MIINKTVLSVCFLTLFAVSLSSMAQTKWQSAHPRREEVNNRLDNQQHAIRHDVKTGVMTRSEGRDLQRQDHTIRAQERADARVNNGHITQHEKTLINHEENNVHQQIKHS